jgi:O-antigen/teichoic acid export membrane protein
MLAVQGAIVALTLPGSILLARSLGPTMLGQFTISQRYCALAIVICHLSLAHGFSYASASTQDAKVIRDLAGLAVKLTSVVAPVAIAMALALAGVN